MYEERASNRCKGCVLRVQVPPGPKPSLGREAGWRGGLGGGWELRGPAANPARMCHCRTRRASPRPGEAMAQQSRARSHRSDLAPGKGASTPLTMLAGGGRLGVSWLSGFGHVRLAQFRVMVPQAREVPAQCRQPLPTPSLAGDPLKSAAPGPPHRGPPEQFIQTHPASPKKLKKAGNGAPEG